MIFYNFLYRFYLEGGICLGSGLLLFCLLCLFFLFGTSYWTADLSQVLLWMRHFGHCMCLFKYIKYYDLVRWVQISVNNSLQDLVIKAKMLLLRKLIFRDYQEWVIFLLG